MNIRSAIYSLGLGAVACTSAFAHPHHGPGDGGLAAGLLHPLTGVDHLLAMSAVGLLAAQLGGRALWALPAAFLGAMAGGGLLGMLGLALPGVELAIALSIVALGAALAVAHKWPLVACAIVVALCGLFHGHPHGAEMPTLAAPVAYAVGFLLATAALHAAGVAAGYFAVQQRHAASGLRVGGAAISVAGLLILLGVL